jgi:hypothetical protein
MRIIRACALLGLLVAMTVLPALAEPLGQTQGNRAPTPTPLVPVATPTRPIPTATRIQAADTPTPEPTATLSLPTSFTPPTPLPPTAAPTPAPLPEASALLEATSRSMDRVTTMRFSGSMDMQVETQGHSFAMTIPMTGEYAAPDRVHTSINVSSPGFSSEMISIGGRVWSRTDGEPWQEANANQFGAPVNPAQLSRMSPAQTAAFLVNASVVDAGSVYQVSSDIDMTRALAQGSAEGSLFGNDMIDASYMNLDGASGQLSMSVNKASQLIESIELVMSLPVVEPPGHIGIRLVMSFTDFNNPSIVVNPPAI